jgi:hypothetical protein
MSQICPFEIGKSYLVLQEISFLNHHFKRGSVVIFKAHGYDFKQGVTRYWFSNTDGNESNAWHVFDNDRKPINDWQTYFAPAETRS